MPKIVEIDLQDERKPDNQKFFNLLDQSKWNDLIERVKDEQLLGIVIEELINGPNQNS